MFDAVLFDFDGLILDTETPLYEAWRLTFQDHGAPPITIEEWALSMGRHDDDPLLMDPVERLRELVVAEVSADEVQALRRAHRDELLAAETIRPGVAALLDEADSLRLPRALASSSPPDWIERFLGPLGLLGRFDAVVCAGNGLPGKPDPAVYLSACELLSADPARSVAFEDSPNGVRAAKAAGIYCVAVPTRLAASLDFSHADLVAESLADVSLATVRGRVAHSASAERPA